MPRLQLTFLALLSAALLLACGDDGGAEPPPVNDQDVATNSGEDSNVGEDTSDDPQDSGELPDARPDEPDVLTDDVDNADEQEDAPDEPDEAVVDYCTCMFLVCHDLYHEIWGDDELQAQNGCFAEAESLPTAGMPTDSGNFLECRQQACDAELCAAGAGREVCVE